MKIKEPKGSFYLRSPKADVSAIVFRLPYKVRTSKKVQYKSYRLSTNLEIAPKQWNDKTKEPVLKNSLYHSKELETLRSDLINFKELALDVYAKYCLKHEKHPDSANEIRDLITLQEHKNHIEASKETFTEFIDVYTSSLDQDNQQGTINKYLHLKQQINDFKKDTGYLVDFDTINLTFKNKFIEWLNKCRKKEVGKPYATSTIHERFKLIKAIMNEAKANNLHNNNYYTANKFNVEIKENQQIALKQSEIDALYNLDLSNDKAKEAIRDLFIIQCYTALRFGDAISLTPENITQNLKGDFNITLKISKTNTIEVLPIVNNEVLEILKKYDYYAPPVQGKNKGSKNAIANRMLKEVCSLVPELQKKQKLEIYEGNQLVVLNEPRYNFVDTHTSRRTFATLEYFKGTPTKLIRMMTKHTSNEMLMKYIKKTSEHDAEMFRQYKAKQKQEKAKVVQINEAI